MYSIIDHAKRQWCLRFGMLLRFGFKVILVEPSVRCFPHGVFSWGMYGGMYAGMYGIHWISLDFPTKDRELQSIEQASIAPGLAPDPFGGSQMCYVLAW